MSALIARPYGAIPRADDERFAGGFTFVSPDSGKEYTIAYDKAGGYWTCSCQGGIHYGRCKHLKEYQREPTRAQVKAATERVARDEGRYRLGEQVEAGTPLRLDVDGKLYRAAWGKASQIIGVAPKAQQAGMWVKPETGGRLDQALAQADAAWAGAATNDYARLYLQRPAPAEPPIVVKKSMSGPSKIIVIPRAQADAILKKPKPTFAPAPKNAAPIPPVVFRRLASDDEI